jgi:hypothetical protein
MTHSATKLRPGEAAYCITVIATVLAEITLIAIGKRYQLVQVVGELLSLLIAALFPIGIVVWAVSRRGLPPLAVIGCILLCGVWCSVIVVALIQSVP